MDGVNDISGPGDALSSVRAKYPSRHLDADTVAAIIADIDAAPRGNFAFDPQSPGGRILRPSIVISELAALREEIANADPVEEPLSVDGCLRIAEMYVNRAIGKLEPNPEAKRG